jgi:hypothetical protein
MINAMAFNDIMGDWSFNGDPHKTTSTAKSGQYVGDPLENAQQKKEEKGDKFIFNLFKPEK